MKRRLQKTFLISYLLVLVACSQSLVMETEVDVPAPLFSRHDLDMAVYYEEDLRGHVYEENSEDRKNWSISTGDSQMELFDKIFSTMFSKVQTIDDLKAVKTSNYDAVIIPKIKDMQFALPSETQTDIYEVWVKYDIHLQEKNEQAIATLPITGYGKTSTALFKSKEEGLKSAANQAFRAIGAKLVIQFRSDPDVQSWLTSRPIAY